ncbi:TIGR00269 family protein [Candidatus Woesearchaeota archaeon]|nr:TIGR00269 family protein [Candidatus Woesearchaeota archaeon]
MKCKLCKNKAEKDSIYCKAHVIKNIEKRVKKTIEKYKLINKKDKVLVAFSGGKDSTVLLYILKRLGYNPEAITINAFIGNYSKTNLKNAIEFCEQYQIKLHHVSFKKEFGYSLCYIISLLKSKGIKLNSCTVCGVLRRYLVNKFCRRMKATKVALGHNLDDEAQAIIMNFARGNLEMSARIGPITGLIKDKRFIPRIKPLYLITEDEITKYSKLQNFNVTYTECPCSVNAYRRSIKETLNKLEKDNKLIKQNIVLNFLKTLPKLKRYYKTTEKPQACKICGEPSKSGICKTCQIIKMIKS